MKLNRGAVINFMHKNKEHIRLPGYPRHYADPSTNTSEQCFSCDEKLIPKRDSTSFEIINGVVRAFPLHTVIEKYYFDKLVFRRDYCKDCFLTSVGTEELAIVDGAENLAYFDDLQKQIPICYYCKYIDNNIDISVKSYALISFSWFHCFYVCCACMYKIF